MRWLELQSGRVDLETRTYEGPDGPGSLTETEARLLVYLVERPAIDVSRDELLVEVWGKPVTSLSRCVDTAMRRLRAKLERSPARPRHLLTRHGHGYRFEPLEASPPDSAPVEPLVGRQDEQRALLAAIAEGARCVTVFGPGGIGKSTLVRSLLERLPAPLTVVPLQPATDPASLVAAVARARSLVLGASTIEGLIEGLGPHASGTLVLDTVEHVVDAAREAVRAIAGACPRLQLVVTTRTLLGVPEEHVVALRPLPLGDGTRLVMQRARRLGVDLDEGVAERIAERLDGLPLAIDLAVARIRALSPDDLLLRLDGDLGWLKARGTEPGDARHRTLADSLGWSWDLLEPAQRTALRQLTVFPGSFGLAHAEAVIEVEGHDSLDLVTELVDTAWLQRDERRYRLLDPVRAFVGSGAPDAGAQQRHAAAMVQLVDDAMGITHDAHRPRVREAFAAVLDDLLAAFDASEPGEDGSAVATLALGIDYVLIQTGPADQRRAILERAWARREAMDDGRRSLVGSVLMRMYRRRGLPYDAVLEDARASAERAGDGFAGRLARIHAEILLRNGDLSAALARLEDGAERCARAGWSYWEGSCRGFLADVHWQLGRAELAVRTCREARQIWEAAGADDALPTVDTQLAYMLAEVGELDEALPRLRSTLDELRAAGREIGVMGTCLHIVGPLLEAGAYDEVEAVVDEGSAIADRLSDTEMQADFVVARGVLAYLAGDPAEAERRLEQAQLRSRDLGSPSVGILVWRMLACARLGREGEARALLDRVRQTSETERERSPGWAFVALAEGILSDGAARAEALARTEATARRSGVVRVLRREVQRLS